VLAGGIHGFLANMVSSKVTAAHKCDLLYCQFEIPGSSTQPFSTKRPRSRQQVQALRPWEVFRSAVKIECCIEVLAALGRQSVPVLGTGTITAGVRRGLDPAGPSFN
jgi:hypothetical protein